MDEDRRKHRRCSLSTEIWIGQDGIFTRSNERMDNLSAGGAFIESQQQYAAGSILSLRFKLPTHPNFITSAVIVRNAQPTRGFGVEFLDISSEDRSQIEAYVEKTLALQF
jgi:Tfp pilus assembly protein PilZ